MCLPTNYLTFHSSSLTCVVCFLFVARPPSHFLPLSTFSHSCSLIHSLTRSLSFFLCHTYAHVSVSLARFPHFSSALPYVRLHSRISYIFRNLYTVRFRSRLFFVSILAKSKFGTPERDHDRLLHCFSDRITLHAYTHRLSLAILLVLFS